MKRSIFPVSLLLFCIVFFCIEIESGQYLRIISIDVESAYPLITINADIALDNSFNKTIDPSNISVYEDNKRIFGDVKIENKQAEEEYLYLVFSIDSSKSISKNILKKIKSSAKEMVSMLGNRDKLAIYQFDSSVTLLNDFSRDDKIIVNNIDKINRHGKKTLLFNAIYDSLELFEKVNQINRKIIVFTDGKDEGSTISEENIIHLAKNAGIPIYFICFQNSDDIQNLARISKMTGGKLIRGSRNCDVTGMYKTIVTLIKNRCIIRYHSHLDLDGGKHKIEVRLKDNEIRDRDSKYILFKKKYDFTAWLSVNYLYILVIGALLIVVLLLIIMIILIRENKLLIKKFSSGQVSSTRVSTSSLSGDPIKKDYHGEKKDEVFIENPEELYANAWVYHKTASGIGNKYLLDTLEVTVGRGEENNIVIHDDSVSTKHAKIKNINGVYYLYDLISERGTYLNGKKLLRPKMLYDWDEIQLGKSFLIFRGLQKPH